jgi:aconitase A
LKVLLENLLRNEDGRLVTGEQASALANWDPVATQGSEIQFMPARVLLQDFTGVSCVVAASIEVPRRLLGDDLSEGVRSKLLNR